MIFKLKKDPDGSISRYKAWLVAYDFHQQTDSKFSETFSHMIKPITVRIILTILAKGWLIRQVDINNTFLDGLLEEDIYIYIYMEQPPGFHLSTATSSLLCKLNKAIYGLKQAPHPWFERLQHFLSSIGFMSSKADNSLSHIHQ